MKIFVIDREGVEHEINAIDGWTLMELIRENGLPITADCGGCCSCATCHVFIDPEWVGKLKEKDEEEEDLLGLAFDVREGSRLSCQIDMSPALDGIKMTLAPE